MHMKGTTILVVRRAGKVVVAGDGQVTMGDTVLKAKARKVRRLFQTDGLSVYGIRKGHPPVPNLLPSCRPESPGFQTIPPLRSLLPREASRACLYEREAGWAPGWP